LPSCADGVDNNCDGKTDGDDPSCKAFYAGLTVQCALPFEVGQPGGDCNGTHTIQYVVKDTNGPQPTFLSNVELLGLDAKDKPIPSGQLSLLSSPKVNGLPGYGAEVHMNSMTTTPGAWHVVSKGNGTRFEDFAPGPMLHITARHGDAEAHAYCS